MSLLSKMRRINKLLQKVAGHAVNFMEMAEVLKETITANVFVISRKGKILGYSIAIPYETSNTAPRIDKDSRIPESYNELLVSIKETTTFHPLMEGRSLPSFGNFFMTAILLLYRLWVVVLAWGHWCWCVLKKRFMRTI